MRKKKLGRALAGSSSLLALSIALPAAGQSPSTGTTKPEDLEEIVVTGLIGSLQRNLDMGFRTQVEPAALSGDAKNAERALRENAIQTERLRAGLPRHRELIRKIVEHGMQTV